jgi:tetratricopeptide (TPR) repeat protein
MHRNLCLLAAGVVLLWAGSLSADDAVLSQMYGSGVHTYFSGDYVEAYEHLTSAIEAGSTDPRCYYFRGLTYVKLGREADAEIDFAKGAELESRDLAEFYDVSRSLGRIQGSVRLALEEYRVEARMEAMQRAEEQRKARYEAIRTEESRVLHPPLEVVPSLETEIFVEPAVEPPPDAAVPDVIVAPLPSPPPAEDPFAVFPGAGLIGEPAPGPSDIDVVQPGPVVEPIEQPGPEATEPLIEPAIGPEAGEPQQPAEDTGDPFSDLGDAFFE